MPQAVDGDERSDSRSARLTPGSEWIEANWLPRIDLDTKGEMSAPTGNRTQVVQSRRQSLYRLSS